MKIENIIFESEDLHINQDGVHLAGFCRRFTIRNLRGKGGSPGDDFIALNADDCLTRQESFDMVNGPQSDILIENISADECHCFLRILSVESTVENVTVRNVSGFCRGTAVNMDAARYCRVPLFGPDDEICETNAARLEIRGFEVFTPCRGDVVEISNLAQHRLKYTSGRTQANGVLLHNEKRSFNDTAFDSLILEKTDV